MNEHYRTFLVLGILGVLAPITSYAQEEAATAEFDRNLVSVFFGGTSTDQTTVATIGLDYEHRLSPSVGIGALLNYAGGRIDATFAAASLILHPVEEWSLTLAVGPHWEDDAVFFGFRGGLAYEVRVRRFSIAPSLNVDLIEGDAALVYGISFGVGFL